MPRTSAPTTARKMIPETSTGRLGIGLVRLVLGRHALQSDPRDERDDLRAEDGGGEARLPLRPPRVEVHERLHPARAHVRLRRRDVRVFLLGAFLGRDGLGFGDGLLFLRLGFFFGLLGVVVRHRDRRG